MPVKQILARGGSNTRGSQTPEVRNPFLMDHIPGPTQTKDHPKSLDLTFQLKFLLLVTESGEMQGRYRGSIPM